MDITVGDAPVGGAVVVAVHGQLGVDSVQRLQETLHGLIDASVHRIVVDLAGLAFCDSTGLSSFVDGHRRCAVAGGWLRLAAPRPFLLRVLAVVGLLDQVPVFDTVPAACTGDPAGLSSPPEDESGIPPRPPLTGPPPF